MVTVAGGGFVASGPHGDDRLPQPWAPPGAAPDRARGRRRGADARSPARLRPRCGSATLVWFRHAKSGELFEHTNDVHLLAGDAIVETVPTYRGTGHVFG